MIDKANRNKLILPTVTAAALWTAECCGQISDGMWENARPFDHWKFWSNCDVEVRDGVRCTLLVSGYGPIKSNYNFEALVRDLGPRMRAYGKMMIAGMDVFEPTDHEILSAAEYMPETYELFVEAKNSGKWQYDFVAKYMERVTLELAADFYAAKYTAHDLREDLRSIKAACRNAHYSLSDSVQV